MKKLFLRLLLGMVVLIGTTVGAAVLWLDRHQAEAEAVLIEALSEKIKTDVHIETIEWNLWRDFPHVSLALQDVSLMGSGNSNAPLIKAERFQLRCNVLALIMGRYQIDGVVIEDAVFSLETNQVGAWNVDVWDPASRSETKNTAFRVESLTLINCRVQMPGATVHVSQVEVHGGWEVGRFQAQVIGTISELVNDSEWPALSEIPLSFSIEWSDAERALELLVDHIECWDGEWAGMGSWNEAEGWNIRCQYDDVVLSHLTAAIPSTARIESNAKASGKLSLEDGVFRVQAGISRSDWRWPSSGTSHNSGPISWEMEGAVWAKYEGKKWRFDVPQCAVFLEGAQWSGTLAWPNATSKQWQAVGTGSVNWEQALWIQALWPTGQGFPSKGNMVWDGEFGQTLNGDWAVGGNWSLGHGQGQWHDVDWSADAAGLLTTDRLDIASAQCTWGGTAFSGSAQISHPFESIDSGIFDARVSLHLPEWNFTPQAPTAIPTPLNSVMLPPGTRVAMDVTMDRLRYGKWVLQDLSAEGLLTEREWQVSRFRSTTLAGSLTGNGALSWWPEEDRATVLAHPVLEGIDLPQLFRAFDDFGQSTIRSAHLEGILSATGSVHFEWVHAIDWLPGSLEMLCHASLKDGALHQLETFQDIAQYLRDNRMMAPWVDPNDLAKRLDHVAFEPLESAIYVAANEVHLPPIKISSSAMDISLEGVQGFNGSLDYTMGFAMRDLRNTREDEFGSIKDDGLGQHFFIGIGGSLDGPEYRWDREAQRLHRKAKWKQEKELFKSLFQRSE